MSNHVLDEREFELVNIVGAQLVGNQRDLSRHMNLSLGMTNMLIKRLVTKGYIRIKQLNQRKVQYLLTPKGITEKMQKSVKYTLKTINSISLIKFRLNALIDALYAQGHRNFWILATMDFEVMFEMVVREMKLPDIKLHVIGQWQNQGTNGVLLICKEDAKVIVEGNTIVVNVVHELSKDNLLV